jgi:5-methylthioadenosine/S-adenosylhomocysteine deaminase
VSWLLRAATPLDARAREDTVDLVIDRDIIVAMGRDLAESQYRPESVIDAHGKLLIPGLVNAHLHSHDRFDRGRFDRLPLEIWRTLYNPPLAPRTWTPRDCYLRTMLNAIELLRGGTTTVIDDVHYGAELSEATVEAVFQAYEDIGLRARVSAAYCDQPFFSDIPYLDGLLPSHLKATSAAAPTRDQVLELWRETARRHASGRVQFALSPSAVDRCTAAFLERTWEISEEYQLPVLVHVLETRIQALAAQRFHGRTMIEHMANLGLLTPRSVLAHCVWVTEGDIDLIAHSDACVVHNPGSNLKLGSGIAPVSRMLAAGIDVGLGTDNNNANDAANMFEAMKLAALVSRIHCDDYEEWIDTQQALAMATAGGSRCAQLPSLTGTLEPSAKADFVLLQTSDLSFVPLNSAQRQLVLAECGRAVDTVVVDGVVVMAAGRIQTVDEPALLAEIAAATPAIADMIRRGAQVGEELRPYLEQAYRMCREDADSAFGPS